METRDEIIENINRERNRLDRNIKGLYIFLGIAIMVLIYTSLS